MRICLVALLVGLVSVIRPGSAICEWQTFTTADGLANNTVKSIFEDRLGNLWFACGDVPGRGLSRYDGIGWETYTTADGLADNRVNAILEDRAGNLWFGTNGGVTRFDGRGWHTYTVSDGLAENRVQAIEEDRAGNLWFGTEVGGVSRYDGESWITYTAGLVNNRVETILEDRSGKLWFGTLRHGLSCFDGVSWTSYTTADGLAGDWVRSIIEDRSGNLWFCTSEGVSRYDGSSWRNYTYEDGLGSNSVSSVMEDRFGNLWFDTDGGGVSRFDGARWRTYTTDDGLPEDSVTSLLEDSSGNLWFGTYSRGVSRYDRSTWRTYELDPGPDFGVYDVLEDHSGRLWFLSSKADVGCYDGVNWRTYTDADGLGGPRATAVAEDRDGNLWFGVAEKYESIGRGASRYDGTGWRTYTTADGLADNYVHVILGDHAGNVWFGTKHGVSRYDGATWRTYTTADGLANDVVVSILEDRNGNLWFGTQRTSGVGGVSRFDGAAWRTYTAADGLAADEVYSILEARSGDIWLRYLHGGVSRFDGETWRTYTVDDGLASDWVNVVFEASDGSLWFGTRGGLSRYDGTAWHTYAAGDGPASGYIEAVAEDRDGNLWFGTSGGATRYDGASCWGTYASADGLPHPHVCSILEDRDGALWFGTKDGVARHEPDRVPPQTVITPKLPRLSTSTSQTVGFGAGYRDLRGIEFSFSFDEGPWSDWSAVNFWQAAGLSDGEHVLTVKARDQIGNVEEAPALCVFEIDAAPPIPIITSPASGEALQDSVLVLGTASDIRFRVYRLEARARESTSWNLVAESLTPVQNGILAGWDTRLLPDGDHELRLSVTDTLGLTGVSLVRVIVDNQEPSADQTAPATVSAADGGDVYTTNREMHLYFAPHSFARDAEVSITALAESDAPDTLAGGARRVLAGYEISWGGAVLKKTATLTMSCDPSGAAGGILGLYVSAADSTWRRLGGTVEVAAQRISCSIGAAGRYALYAEAQAASGPPGLFDLRVTPRTLSPKGVAGGREAAISFTLGRAGPVTVKVFNKAGRLVRNVLSNRTMNAGANLVSWDGRDDGARWVEDGVFLVTVEAAGRKQVKTLAVVR